MAVYVSPASDVDLLTSSLGPLLPIQDGGDGVVYFIYYSHGTDVGSWELFLELLVSWTITVLKGIKPKKRSFSFHINV